VEDVVAETTVAETIVAETRMVTVEETRMVEDVVAETTVADNDKDKEAESEWDLLTNK
jgi:hypothetical protein